ncbi:MULTISPECIES: hypothetical protein [Cryobacterium]|uniref:Uncharacterized protein n=1 Tax=Cryobacterium breve TaxID=1259258 RepID=A0ABY2IYB0_9MICO|nr:MULTISPECIES: hypothetical protein [Cryobacterium]TFC96697.1 hypothetical protein E3T20_01440 [Cryobacterium sp. TmT3-12]TFC97506.1 hypothetical protein E3O65_12060 [Cryobacterium breve]
MNSSQKTQVRRAGSTRRAALAAIACVPLATLIVSCAPNPATPSVRPMTVDSVFTDFAESIRGVVDTRTRARNSGPLGPGTIVVFDVIVKEDSTAQEMDATARQLTQWVRVNVQEDQEITVHVTLFASGNAVSLSTDDGANWARILVVDEAVRSDAVLHAWLRAPWLGDPRSADDDGRHLELVTTLSPGSLPSAAIAAGVEAYTTQFPPRLARATVIDSSMDGYSSGYETDDRSISVSIDALPPLETLSCVDDVDRDPGVRGYSLPLLSLTGELGRSAIELQPTISAESEARLVSLPCLANAMFSVDGD